MAPGPPTRPSRLLRRVRAALLVALAVLAVAVLYVETAGNREDLRPADCLLVPGARVLADGTPAAILRARVTRAAELYREGLARGIVLTGGRGASGAVESEGARRLAESLGVPASAIETEDQSHDTLENFLYAREAMRRRGWGSCLVVTDPFHEPRCMLLAEELGIPAWPAPAFESPSRTRLRLRLWYDLRESASLVKYWLRWAVLGTPASPGPAS